MKKYNICVIHRQYEAHIFNELMGSLAYGLKVLGNEVYTSVNSIKDDAINIILGSHISPGSLKSQLPAGTIIFNTEQYGSVWMTEEYTDLLKSFQIWDYSIYNIRLLKTCGIENITYNPIEYCPLLERISHYPEEKKDIDVLMYGSVNPRRTKIMEELNQKGLKTVFATNVYGQERDNLVSRSKIILNVHYYNTAILETVRLSYLLNNMCFVITERSRDWRDCPIFWYTMVMSDYNWLVEDCMEYIKSPERRRNVAGCGYELFKENKQEDLITL